MKCSWRGTRTEVKGQKLKGKNNYSTAYQFIFISIFFLLLLVNSPAILADTSVYESSLADSVRDIQNETKDETVRRIVERAMAAVELAEANANRSIAEMQGRLNELEERIKLKDSEITEVKKELDITNNVITELRIEKNKLEETISKLNQNTKNLEDSYIRVSALLVRSENEKKELEERIESLHSSLSLSEKAYQDAMNTAAEAESRAKTAVSEDVIPADSYFELQKKLQNAEKISEDLKNRLDIYRHRSTLFEETIRKDSETIGSLKNENDLFRALIADSDRVLQSEIKRIRDAFDSAAETIAVIQNEKNNLRQLYAMLKEERDSLYMSLEANKLEIKETMRVVKESMNAIQRIRIERDELAKKLAELSNDSTEVKELSEKLRLAEVEISALRSALLTVPSQKIDTVVMVPVMPVRIDTLTETKIPEKPFVRIDFTKALLEELEAIPEIGPTRARAIVWYRENVKPIESLNDLKFVPGFNDERIRAIELKIEN